MNVGDPVQTPRGEAIVESWTPFTTCRFGRFQTVVYVYVRYPNDVVRLYPISELTPIKGEPHERRTASNS